MNGCYLNSTRLIELTKGLDGSEIKGLFAVILHLSNTGEQWFINNEKGREAVAAQGFEKTPARFSAILGSLVKKGVLTRVANGVYSLPEGLITTLNNII